MREFLHKKLLKMKGSENKDNTARSFNQNSTLDDSSLEIQLDNKLNMDKLQKRNEQIFQNVTFDHKGNPLTVLAPDLTKSACYKKIEPKFKFTDKVPEAPPAALVVEEKK